MIFELPFWDSYYSMINVGTLKLLASPCLKKALRAGYQQHERHECNLLIRTIGSRLCEDASDELVNTSSDWSVPKKRSRQKESFLRVCRKPRLLLDLKDHFECAIVSLHKSTFEALHAVNQRADRTFGNRLLLSAEKRMRNH